MSILREVNTKMFYYFYREAGSNLVFYTNQGIKKVKISVKDFLKKETSFALESLRICNMTTFRGQTIYKDLYSNKIIDDLSDYYVITGFEISKYSHNLQNKMIIDIQYLYKYYLKKVELFRYIYKNEFNLEPLKDINTISELTYKLEEKYGFLKYIISRVNSLNCNFSDVLKPTEFLAKKIDKLGEFNIERVDEEIKGGYFKFSKEKIYRKIVVGDFNNCYPNHIREFNIGGNILSNVVNELINEVEKVEVAK